MTKKDGVWLNGRIELWQKKMKFEWTVKYYWIETEKDESPTNGRLGFGQKQKKKDKRQKTKNFSTLSSSLTRFTIRYDSNITQNQEKSEKMNKQIY